MSRKLLSGSPTTEVIAYPELNPPDFAWTEKPQTKEKIRALFTFAHTDEAINAIHELESSGDLRRLQVTDRGEYGRTHEGQSQLGYWVEAPDYHRVQLLIHRFGSLLIAPVEFLKQNN